MCKPNERRRFKAVYLRKFKAFVRFIDPANAHSAALKSAEIATCVKREEVFTN